MSSAKRPRAIMMERRISLAALAFACIVTCYQHATAFQTLGDASLRRLAEASSLSYLDIDRMPSSPYKDTCQLDAITQVVDDLTESGATVFRDESTNTIVVACRGSANIKNFSTNLKFDLVPATRLSLTNPPASARVHKGFHVLPRIMEGTVAATSGRSEPSGLAQCHFHRPQSWRGHCSSVCHALHCVDGRQAHSCNLRGAATV